ncbi:hypothetical protein [Aeromicrobium sp.]|uniref:hypothetical protein n=1 Tax=Aeromicrobium sp. TaxID=1871063 RepID=UPI0019CD4C23|nr:hypothetical protein [Aeromicrobium sp.]MBC7630814.1 hypothetical protein [Aeromicrobium sp.]
MATSPRRRRYHPSSPFQAKPEVPAEVYEVGARVSHDTFGLGRIVSIQGTQSVQVDFGADVKHIPLPCAKMTNL